MTQQSEAQRLADKYAEAFHDHQRHASHETRHDMLVFRDALGAELRRLQSVETESKERILRLEGALTKEVAINAQLLEALEWIANRCPEQMLKQPLHTIHQEAVYDAGACARAVIAKAEGTA